jgi:hypothetical protein
MEMSRDLTNRLFVSPVTGPSRHLLSNVAYTMNNAAPGDNQEAALWKDATSYLAIR